MSETLLGYAIDGEIFRSRDTIVYRGHAGDVRAILKVLREHRPTAERLARYQREYEILRRLDGKTGVPRALGLGRDGDRVVLAVEDVDATSLFQVLTASRLRVEDTLAMAVRAAEALVVIHAAGIVHRDINPSNLVWNRHTEQVQIIGFGLASLLATESVRFDSALIKGTLAYMSPEQTGRMNRSLDYRSDLYSLGATLYHALSGQRPFTATDPLELMHAHLARMPRPLVELDPAIAPQLSDIVARLLAKSAEDRYQSAASVGADLVECLRQLRCDGNIRPFELERDRRPLHFVLPQKLYGREVETAALTQAFWRIVAGTTELVLISGYSGIGKSSLVQELYRPLTESKGRFLSGKFDQLRRDVPYAPLVDALRSIVRELLGTPQEELLRWRSRIDQALAPNGQVLVEVIPELALVIGEQAPVPELAAAESQLRFELAVGRFLALFAAAAHPLVLFLDDLQWADKSSLKLIEGLLLRADVPYLLVIGSYRDNEVNPGHPLSLMRAKLAEGETRVSEILLPPLADEPVYAFVADTVGMPLAAVRPLAELVLAKTHGNPFFLREFIKALHDEQLIWLDVETGHWTWNVARIRTRAVTDNVVHLMQGKLRALGPIAHEVLQVAGALGAQFDLRSLALACGRDAIDVWRALWPALAEGMVVALDDSYQLLPLDSASATTLDDDAQRALAQRLSLGLKFAHDRIQEAAAELTPAAERPALRARIGRRLLEGLGDDAQGTRLFDVVGHLNAGRALIVEKEERARLAELNALAVQRAKASSAFSTARVHAVTGLEILGSPATRWTRSYDLTLQLINDAAETAYQTGDFSAMEEAFAEGIAYARDPIDTAWLHQIKIEALNAHGRPLDALAHALDYLEVLGVTIPREPNADDIAAALGATEQLLASRSFDDLASMSDAPDPKVRIAVTLICKIHSSAYVASPLLFILLALRQMQLVATHGNTPVSALVFAVYGLLIAGLTNNVTRGYEFGHLSSRLLVRPDVARYKAQALHLFNCHTRFWREHVRLSADGEREAFQVGLDTGEMEYGTYGAHVASKYALFHGQELAGLLVEVTQYTRALQRSRNDIAYHSHLPWHQAIVRLTKPGPEPWVLSGDVFDEALWRPRFEQGNDRMAISNANLAALLLACVFERFDEAVALADAGAPYLDSVLSQFNQPLHHFLAALARYTVCGRLTGAERAAQVEKADEALGFLRGWAQAAPVNFAQKVALLEAERLRMLGESKRARDRYEDAVALAHQHEFLLDEALAAEAAARAELAASRRTAARHWLEDARDAWRAIGARSKVAALRERYPDLLPDPHVDVFPALSSSALFDAVSVTRAMEAVSSEIVLESLLRRVLGLALENAGADRGLLILTTGEHTRVEASADLASGTSDAALHLALEDASALLPIALVQYVLRAREAVVLEDAAVRGPFKQEPYIAATRPRSVLCTPLLHQGILTGVLYLENRLTAEAFSERHVEVLRVLTGPIAIAIENARLYRSLEEKNRQLEITHESTRRFVPIQYLGLLRRKDVTEIKPGDHIELDVSVLFSDIRTFTQLSERLGAGQIFHFINEYLAFMEPEILRHGGVINQYYGDGIMALFHDNADGAVAAAVDMQVALGRFNDVLAARGQAPIVTGIGINSGAAVLGTIGGGDHLACTVISDAVNTASRVEGMTKVYAARILISEATRTRLRHPDAFTLRPVDKVLAKGKLQPIPIYEVIDGDPAPLRAEKLAALAEYTSILDRFYARDFKNALSGFARLAALHPDDRVLQIYCERSVQYVSHGVPDDWDGVIRLESK